MLSINTRTLPNELPALEAMRNRGHGEVAYDPEYWELDYRSRRYLEELTSGDLEKRFEGTVRSLSAFANPGRVDVPIDIYLGAWYWFRKDHQIRLEYFLRGEQEPTFPYPISSNFFEEFEVGDFASGQNMIFRYTTLSRALDLVRDGIFYVGSAAKYQDPSLNVAQRDDELTKSSFMLKKHVTITTEDGRVIKPLSDVRRSVTASNYNQVSFCTHWDSRMFDYFETEVCIVVNELEEFRARLMEAGKEKFNNWYFECLPVQYFDPYELLRNERPTAVLSKDISFAYQREFRVFWDAMEQFSEIGPQTLNLGVCKDIMQIYRPDGSVVAI